MIYINKKSIESNKHKLIIIGSARGINRFYIVNLAMNYFQKAKVINTSKLIKSLISDFELPDLDNISLLNYFKYVEPMLTKNILAHLEHSDVILDTTYYYLLPGISAKEILKFSGKIRGVILVLVSDNSIKIQKANDGDWFKDINNIQDDILLNQHSFDFYCSLFSEFTKVNNLKINLNIKYDETTKKFFLTL